MKNKSMSSNHDRVLAMPNKSVSIFALNICNLKGVRKSQAPTLQPEHRVLEVHNALIRMKTLDKSDFNQPKWRRAVLAIVVVIVVIVSTYVRLSGKVMT